MSESTYLARAQSKTAAAQAIQAIPLLRNSNGQYQHDAGEKAITAILSYLRACFNSSQSGQGMFALSERATNSLTSIKSTDCITTDSILRDATAAAVLATGDTQAVQTKYTRSEARDEADSQNYAIQATIGTKEGTAEGITALVGSAITDQILKNVDGTPKTVDEYHLYELIQAVRDGAIRPEHHDILRLAKNVIEFQFDWRKKIQANLEQLKVLIERGKSSGLNLDVTFIVSVLLANLHSAVQHDWGRDLFESHQKIRKQYPHGTTHTTTSLQVIMTELTAADNARDPSNAPAPTKSSAYAANEAFDNSSIATDPLNYLSSLMQDTDYEESAFGATNNSDSSIESKKSTKSTTRNKPNRRGGRSKSKDRGTKTPATSDKWQNNPCKHCKKFKRRNQHPDYPTEQCFWNTKMLAWRPRWVCDEMEVKYKPRHTFEDGHESD